MAQTNDVVTTAETGRVAGGRSADVAALVAAVGLGDSTVIGTLYDHGVRAVTVPALEWLRGACCAAWKELPWCN